MLRPQPSRMCAWSIASSGLDGGDVSWARRDRLFRCDWTIIPCDATVVRQEAHCTVLKFKVNKGPCSHWLDRGACWPGETTGQLVPTLVRHVPRKKPPWDPRGIHRCSEVAKQRWAAARWPEVPGHFEDRFLVKEASGKLRLPSATEKERLHSCRRNHTLGVVQSSRAKSDPNLDYAERSSCVGDGFNHVIVAWLVGHLCLELGYMTSAPTMQQIIDRDTRHLLVVRRHNHFDQIPSRTEMGLAESLTRWYLARVDSRGSDVRLVSGELLRPHRVSRQSINPSHWRWRTSMAWSWKRQGSHINELEAIAILLQLKAKSRSQKNFASVYLHLVDSQVSIGVFTKKRSSSRLLQRVIRRANALCLAAHLHPVFIYVRSELNPADAPSRGAHHLKHAASA